MVANLLRPAGLYPWRFIARASVSTSTSSVAWPESGDKDQRSGSSSISAPSCREIGRSRARHDRSRRRHAVGNARRNSSSCEARPSGAGPHERPRRAVPRGESQGPAGRASRRRASVPSPTTFFQGRALARAFTPAGSMAFVRVGRTARDYGVAVATKGKQPTLDRDRTDSSLRAERETADEELAKTRGRAKTRADDLLDRAREQADETLGVAREKADAKLEEAELPDSVRASSRSEVSGRRSLVVDCLVGEASSRVPLDRDPSAT